MISLFKTHVCQFVAAYILLAVLFLAFSASAAQPSKGSWLTGEQADVLWNELANAPYAQNGDRGLVIYMLSYSGCGNCIAFLREFWESHRSNMELREIFAPIDHPQYLNEAADIALTRNPVFADFYYHRSRVAPVANGSPERQAALQKVANTMTRVNALFGQIGHIQNGYPTFVFRVRERERRRTAIVSGFGPDFARQLEIWVKEAGQ